MPIRPENKGRYPANWREIRSQILARAGNRCERWGVENHAWVIRDSYTAEVLGSAPSREAAKVLRTELVMGMQAARMPVRIVLTIAHVENPDPADCRPENLQALCQRCHNRLDAPMRAKNAAETKRKRRVASELPGLEAGAG